MKHIPWRRAVNLFLTAALLAGLLGFAMPVAAAGPEGQAHMPPNEVAIIKALRGRGVIPANATPEQEQAIYQKYVQQKLAKPEDRPNPLGAKAIAQADTTGKPVKQGGGMKPNNQRFDNVLTLLVEFTGDEGGMVGPLHNQIAKPDPATDNTSYWVEDFSAQHYKDMLFSTKSGTSMAAYYLEQSGGAYTVDGQVYGWVRVPHSEWYYGADTATGTDDLNGPVWRVVADAVAIAGNSIPWAQFDTEDPYDMDGDGNLNEPDGYVDHIQLVHAGADQSAGGGAQGDSAIWAHSWFADSAHGGVPTSDPNVRVGAYTINPEDGTIGVFCHEFAHNLGLPDQYDTIYSGEASQGFWNLMASGSWSGCPGEALGTCPAPMTAWEKYVMGWLDPVVVNPGESASNVTLKSATSTGPAQKAIRVNLPNYDSTYSVNTPHSGALEWYSGKGDALNNTLTRSLTLPTGSAVLKFWTWYDIEDGWDYGYVEVSADGGSTWATVAGSITTTTNPNGNNVGNGITGSSDWTEASFDLSAYAGQTVLLRFRYSTDEAVQGLGWAIDDISLNGALVDDVEGDLSAWTADGWAAFAGQAVRNLTHYYLAEWRTPTGFDVSLNSWYNFTYGNFAEFYKASPGMLVWYRDTGYTDNWVGEHPWHGQLLLVDAHPDLVLANDLTRTAKKLFKPDPKMGLPFRTRIQIADAAFGLTETPEQPLTSWFGIPTNSALPALAAAPTFDDSVTYVDRTWEPWFQAGDYATYICNSISSVLTPHYGLKMTVTAASSGSGKVNVDFSGFHMPE